MAKKFLKIAVFSVAVLFGLSLLLYTTEDYITDGEAAQSVWYADKSGTAYIPPQEETTEIQEENRRLIVPPEESEGLSELKDGISEYISSQHGKWGIYVKNLASNEYLLINDGAYSSASLIKLFTMAAVYNEIQAGSFEETEDIKNELALMICESDNSACNRLTRLIGGGSARNGFDVENRNTGAIGCSYTTHGSELVDGHGRVTFVTYNVTSPRDCGIVLEKIYRETLVSPQTSDEMLELLKAQERRWKIPDSLPEGTVTANKTGETDTTEADAAIVFSPACDYIICVIGNNAGGKVETIRNISRMTYDFFNAQ